MSSSKIEEVGEARRSMNAICGVMDYCVYGLLFTVYWRVYGLRFTEEFTVYGLRFTEEFTVYGLQFTGEFTVYGLLENSMTNR